MSVVLLSLFLIFELIQQTAVVNFMLLLSILNNSAGFCCKFHAAFGHFEDIQYSLESFLNSTV